MKIYQRLFVLTCTLASLAAVGQGSVRGYKTVAPTEKERFVTYADVPAAPQGLDGTNIALWQSHGWYFEPKLNRWEWQRARLFQTVEDLYTQGYVMPFLMPMLENAGAYVMSPRERDTSTTEIIADNDGRLATGGYKEISGSKKWEDTKQAGFAYKTATLKDFQNPFREGTARQVATVNDAHKVSTATWSADIPKAGDYAVYVSYQSLPESADDAVYTVHTAAGDREVKVNQKMGGGTWIYLGHFPLAKGENDIVTISNLSNRKDAVITADAVKIGGGMGNVARKVKEPQDDVDYEYTTSGYPRFTEGARYWMQWAGVPDSVYTLSRNVNDYTDDYKSRGEWVNWLAGGSSVLPDRNGLNIPVDLAFAFHSDAGTTQNDSIIGTLGIYFTNKNGKYANGTDRRASGALTDMIMTTIVDDIQAEFEPKWTRREMWDKSYYEARVPEVPTMLLELLSHQNFADMKYGLDPTFRFVVSRAVYKGMLKFLAERDGRAYVVQPLPVNSMAINRIDSDKYTLTWQPTRDQQEITANPTYYIIEERDGATGTAWKSVATVYLPEYQFTVSDDQIHCYRVIAGNDGGRSFPSEALAMCAGHGDKQPVLVVNGFTRVSGPDWWEADGIGGFYDDKDSGVPYVSDISYIGKQYEFDRSLPWVDDDAPGFGASRADYETKVIAGNTFDYTGVHGQAIHNAGYPFISMSLQAFMEADSLPEYQTVDLILGKQKETVVGRGVYGSRFKTFPAELQQKLSQLAARGGNILVTGSYIATDMWKNAQSSPATLKADQKFTADILGYKWRTGQASVTGEAKEVPSRFKQFGKTTFKFYNTLNEDCYAIQSPDAIYPADDSTAAIIMRYTENTNVAGTALDNGKHKCVAIGFPFETIEDASARDASMKQTLDFFAAPHKLKKATTTTKAPTTTNTKATKKKSKKKK
ncbi:MAG: xanthan lyase [Bacteroidales bacterium]|nr:xanthan lyase [Bacteroidales bacterium]